MSDAARPKYRLQDMSWLEAEEAFRRVDTAIVPVGTLHAHGPIPIGIDFRSVEVLADEVGKRTGVLVLPVVAYGENDKMKQYPGTIAIDAETLRAVYTDICRSLRRNGIRRVIFLNGHGGNHEPLLRAGRTARELGMLVAIVGWGEIERALMPHVFTRGNYTSRFAFAELGMAVAIDGLAIADLREGVYKGEWGFDPIVKPVFGDRIAPAGFSSFTFAGAPVTIPVDAWEVDDESPPRVDAALLEELRQQGSETLARMTDYISAFVREFQTVKIPPVPPA